MKIFLPYSTFFLLLGLALTTIYMVYNSFNFFTSFDSFLHSFFTKCKPVSDDINSLGCSPNNKKLLYFFLSILFNLTTRKSGF